MTPIPRFWIGTNWKMNKTLAEATAFARALKAADADRDPRIQRFVLPAIHHRARSQDPTGHQFRKGWGTEHALVGSWRLDRRSFSTDAHRLQS